MDDAALVAALRAGDDRVFASLVDAWSPAMLRLARMHVATHETAEDVVQEAWLAAVRGLDRFEGRSTLRTWVFHILLNIARTRGVKDQRTVPFSSLGDGDDRSPTVDPARFRAAGEEHAGGWRVPPQPWPTPEGNLLSKETRAVIDACLAALPARQRAVLELRDVHGYDAAEVCDLLDVTLGNQRVLLHRARAAVRGALEVYFAQPRPVESDA